MELSFASKIVFVVHNKCTRVYWQLLSSQIIGLISACFTEQLVCVRGYLFA